MPGLRGKYRLGRRIGGGGMAEVFEAELVGAEGFARPVAIKRMLPALSADPAFGAMFVNEARLASLLHHENIVSVLDFDRDEEGRYFLVMELVHGIDLRELVRSGPLPASVAGYVAAEVLEGLAYAHDREQGGKHLGIVHRDVSPHNVMISWDGAVKVVDFGIAKAVAATGVSQSGSIKGKVGYMSPEQAHGLDLDGRADVFAVGAMLHEMLTGRRLFDGATEPEVLARLLHQPIPSPREIQAELPDDLAAVTLRMLARDRDARYPTARHAHHDLLHCASLSARSGLELRQLLGTRFPGRAPRRRAESEPAFPMATPSGASGETPSGHAPAPAHPAATRPLRSTQTAGTPTGAGELDARASRIGVWIAVVLAAGLAVAATVLVITHSGGDGDGDAAAAGEADAAPLAGDEREIDAAAALASAQPIDAGAPETTDEPEPAAIRRTPGRRTPRRRRPDAAVPVATRAAPVDAAPAPAPIDAAPPPPGKLRFVVRPWGKIYIDGTYRGESPRTLTLPPGRYSARIVNPDLGTEDARMVIVVSDDERVVNVDLRR